MSRNAAPRIIILVVTALIVVIGLGLAGAMLYVAQVRASLAPPVEMAAGDPETSVARAAIAVTATPQPTALRLPIVVVTYSPTSSTATPAGTPTFALYPAVTQVPTLDIEMDITLVTPARRPTHIWVGTSGSKLGLHVSRNSSPAIMDFVRQAQPAVIKAVDDVGFLAEVKQISPGTVTVGRFVVEQPDMGQGDPAARADEFVAGLLDRYLANPGVDFWEGWNEPDVNQMDWYGQFEARRACKMRDYGLRAAIGGFSTGTPEPDQFLKFLPAIRAALECDGILTLHEYAAPTLHLWFGQGVPGRPSYPDRGPLMARYRWFYRDILQPRGLVIPLVISEAGIDGLVAMGRREGPIGPGWREFKDWWTQQGLTKDADQFYVDQLAWYDSLVRQDPYVIGFTVYQAGGAELPGQASYDIVDLLPRLTQYVKSVP